MYCVFCVVFAGTPYTMSPEVCNNQPYSTKTDIWVSYSAMIVTFAAFLIASCVATSSNTLGSSIVRTWLTRLSLVFTIMLNMRVLYYVC